MYLSKRVFVFSVFMWAALGCSSDAADTSPCGDDGVLVEIPGEQICAYKQAIVIETGFSCPQRYSNRQDFEGYTLCSRRSGGLNGEQVGQVEDRLINEFGWSLWKLEPDEPKEPEVTPVQVTGNKMDVLFVVDNSFSMCQEQAILRSSVWSFVDMLKDKDFHLALTTTHAPESDATIEPVAREARLQSTPQPVPGNNQGCLRDESGFGPLRESLVVAQRCLADPAQASNYEWTDAQIDCALQSPTKQGQTGCVTSSGLPDRNEDARYDVFDLFPDSSEYKVLPRVFKRADYELASGDVDATRLELDLGCAMTVGTRGDGYEKGLRVAVNAVSPELTGGAVELSDADVSAVNHGLIRKNAKFGLVFISDENDCSHDGGVMELGNACGSNICEYMNSTSVAEEDTALVPTDVLAEQLIENLALTKGEDVSSSDIYVASIVGTEKRFNEPFPTCGAGTNPEVTPVCASALGEAYSGDRYVRFTERFENHYPDSSASFGWMCTDSFSPALAAIGELFAN